MTVKYPYRNNSRVVLLSSVGDVAAPTVTALNAAVDVTCDLTIDGLNIDRATSQLAHELWAEDRVEEEPDRYVVRCQLSGYRFEQPLTEPLWEACATFRAPVVLVARLGIRFDATWAAGQKVDVVVGRWGKRSPSPTGGTYANFSVPILVTDDDDAAVVAA